MILKSLSLGFALAIDAMIIAFAYGLILRSRRRAGASFKLAGTTGFFQFFMPIVGFGAAALIFDFVRDWSAFIACAVFCLLGANVILNAFKKGENGVPAGDSKSQNPLTLNVLLAIGLATSIDALAAGAGIRLGARGNATLLEILVPATIIGIVTFFSVFGAFHATKILPTFPKRRVELLAGLLLIALGILEIW